MPDEARWVFGWVVLPLCPAVAGGVFVVRRRRCRRAAAFGMAAVGLWFGWVVAANLGADYHAVFRWLTGRPQTAAAMLAGAAHRAAAHALLVWAVLADRPPPPADD